MISTKARREQYQKELLRFERKGRIVISKELLSEVYGSKVIDFLQDKVDYNQYGIFFEDGEMIVTNVYGLANKCKEWAFSKGYEVFSGRHEKKEWTCDLYFHNAIHYDDYNIGLSYLSATEQEAIFIACEWILNASTNN